MNSLFNVSIALFLVIYVESVTKKSGKADLTNYESNPKKGSKEWKDYNGGKWSGRFAFIDGKQSLDWVKKHNIISVHHKDASKYKLKTFKITQGSHHIEAKVYDECSDKDCNDCCTKNSKKTGFLIDMEKYTLERFGGKDGIVEWTCLDC